MMRLVTGKNLDTLLQQQLNPNAATRVTGDLWWDTATNSMFVWNGTAHVPVGIGSWYNCGKNCTIVDTGGTFMYVLLNNTITDL